MVSSSHYVGGEKGERAPLECWLHRHSSWLEQNDQKKGLCATS